MLVDEANGVRDTRKAPPAKTTEATVSTHKSNGRALRVLYANNVRRPQVRPRAQHVE